MINKRRYHRFGVILPVFSLPSDYGIGSIGNGAYRFIDFLADSSVSLWQILPLGPTSYGDSPYQCFSAFAGNDYFIDLDLLAEDNLLTEDELSSVREENGGNYIDYGNIYNTRYDILEAASKRFWNNPESDFKTFFDNNKDWLVDFALYMSIKRHCGMSAWVSWPEEYKMRDPDALSAFSLTNDAAIKHHYFCQYTFYKQWNSLLQYAHSKGISVIGDVPFYVSMDSADVWANKDLFRLDSDGYPTVVAGVPPDYFSETGQLWGNPIYAWNSSERDVYKWWGRRVSHSSSFFDYLRIDHFRGFDSYWTVPAEEKTAINGKWIKGPGIKFIRYLKRCAGDMRLIAEDLGLLTPSVKNMLKKSRLPGMKVLEFAFSGDEDSEYLPEHHTYNCVCYTGTHDNEPLYAWLTSLDPDSEAFLKQYMDEKGLSADADGIIQLGMASKAKFFIVQLQDLLGTGEESRINTPGVEGNNWRWRLAKEQLTPALASEISSLVKKNNRHK